MSRCAIAVVVLLISSLAFGAEKRSELKFSYITSKSVGFVSAGGIPAVDLALELINNRTDVLPNHTLSYTNVLDSQCAPTPSLNAFMEHFNNNSQPTYVSLLCCGCSLSGIPVAEISHYWNVPQMADIASAYVLNDRTRFKGFFRTLPSFEFVGPTLAKIAREFGWTQMAITTQDETLYNLVTESLDSILTAENIFLDTTAIVEVNADPFPYKIFDWERDYRVIIINGNPFHAYPILCEASHRKMLSPKYVWFFPGWYDRGWWSKDSGNKSCTPDIMRRIVNSSLTYTPNGFFVLEDRDMVTFSGLSSQQYDKEYSERLKQEQYQAQNITEFVLSGAPFDAMWALALGLHFTSESVRQNDSKGCDSLPGDLVPLELFDYENQRMGCLMRKSLHNVTFLGITGTIAFDSNGSRISNSILLQQHYLTEDEDIEMKSVADIVIYHNESIFMYKENITSQSLWPGGIPYDGAARDVFHHNHIALVCIYSILATAGIVYSFICLIFNTIFRNHRAVKPSSPNLNYLIIAGALLLYIAVYMYTISVDHRETQTALCITRQWLFSIGYDLCFAVTLAKTWRIYYIFANAAPNVKNLPRDWFLLVIVLVVVAMDSIVTLIGSVVPSIHFNATRVPDIMHPMTISADGITHANYVFDCLNHGTIVWLAISYAYKGLLQLVAMFMGFHVRKVTIKEVKETKEIVVIIYINSLTLILWVVADFVLVNYHDAYSAIFGLALLSGASVFLTFVFVPKMVKICTNKSKTSEEFSSSTFHSNPTVQADEVHALKSRILELEDMLRKTKKD